jgi:hypothetical protein
MNTTTLNGAHTETQTSLKLTSGTGVDVGDFMKIDSEFMKVLDITTTPLVKVARGVNSTLAAAHGTLATVAIGLASEFPPVGQFPSSDGSGLPDRTYTYGASGAITVAPGLHILKGPSGSVTMTLADPTAAQNGMRLTLTAATSQAYTVTSVSGFGAGGGALDVATYNAIGDTLVIQAINGVWNIIGNAGVVIS